VKGQNYLGIYISKNTATALCLSSESHPCNVLDCFSVTVENNEEQKLQQLLRLLTQACTQKIPAYQNLETSVALDCTLFMQHRIHTEFTDPKQIAQTIRFDTEDVLAADISNVAISFRIDSSDETGSDVTVFTTERKLLSDILLTLQGHNIDPVTIEPDVNCLARFVSHNLFDDENTHPLFAILSRQSGYFIVPQSSDPRAKMNMRTFLVRPNQDRTLMLAREIPLTLASVETDTPVNCLKIFDTNNSVDSSQLSQTLTIQTSPIDLAAAASVSSDLLVDCANTVDFAIACGAALAHLGKTPAINFRNDFMPYQGKKERLLKTVKFLSVSLTILMLAVGLYFHLQLIQRNKYRSQLYRKFKQDYAAIMFTQRIPHTIIEANRKLGSEFRRVRDAKSGQLNITGQASITAKLTLVLDSFNKCAKKANLNIDSISVSARNITVTGDTSSRKNTLLLFNTIKDRLNITQQSYKAKGGRDSFHVVVIPKK